MLLTCTEAEFIKIDFFHRAEHLILVQISATTILNPIDVKL